MYRRRGVTILSLLDTSTADRFYPCSISNSTSVCVVPVCECCAQVCMREISRRKIGLYATTSTTPVYLQQQHTLSSTRTRSHTRTFSFSFFQWHTFSWMRVNQHSTHTLAFTLKTKERFQILSLFLSFRVSLSLSFLTWDNHFLFPRVSQFQRNVNPNRRRRRFFV